MREIDKIHEKASIILIRILNSTMNEMQEDIAKAALKNPILFHDLFNESNQEEEKTPPTWRDLAQEGYFSEAVKSYKETLFVDAWRAIERVTEYCESHDYHIPNLPSPHVWQQYAPNQKINAIKEFRAFYQPLFPWIDLVTAKNVVENYASGSLTTR
jgi:hypothetical protein